MRKLSLILLAALAFATPCFASSNDDFPAVQGQRTDTPATDSTSAWSIAALLKGIFANTGTAHPISGQHITSLSSAAALTVPSGSIEAWVTVDSNATYSGAVNCTDDGTTPTSTVGHTLAAGAHVFIKLGNLAAFQCIQQSATAAIYVSYYK